MTNHNLAISLALHRTSWSAEFVNLPHYKTISPSKNTIILPKYTTKKIPRASSEDFDLKIVGFIVLVRYVL